MSSFTAFSFFICTVEVTTPTYRAVMIKLVGIIMYKLVGRYSKELLSYSWIRWGKGDVGELSKGVP